MSDHYPSIKADKDLQAKCFHQMKVGEEKRQQKTQKQHERILAVNNLIKKYNRQETTRPRRGSGPDTSIDDPSITISAKDIVLNPYVYSPDYQDHFEEQS